jgi:hypothetical protein
MSKKKWHLAFISMTTIITLISAREVSANEEEGRIRQGIWGHIAFTVEHSMPFGKPIPEAHQHLINISELSSNGQLTSAWVVNKYGVLRRLNFNCESGGVSVDMWGGGGLFSSRTLVIDVKVYDPDMAEALPAIQRKLCGTLVYPLGRIARYLWSDAGPSGKERNTIYWIPSESYRSADSVVIKGYAVDNWDSMQANLPDSQQFFSAEFHCRDAKSRSQPLDSWQAPAAIADGVAWSNSNSVIRNRLCFDSSIMPSPEPLKKENDALRKGEAANLESAKRKCIELGFKQGTEKFGECVLTLSR